MLIIIVQEAAEFLTAVGFMEVINLIHLYIIGVPRENWRQYKSDIVSKSTLI